MLKAGKTKLKLDPDFVRFKDREPKPALAVAGSPRNTDTDVNGDSIPF